MPLPLSLFSLHLTSPFFFLSLYLLSRSNASPLSTFFPFLSSRFKYLPPPSIGFNTFYRFQYLLSVLIPPASLIGFNGVYLHHRYLPPSPSLRATMHRNAFAFACCAIQCFASLLATMRRNAFLFVWYHIMQCVLRGSLQLQCFLLCRYIAMLPSLRCNAMFFCFACCNAIRCSGSLLATMKCLRLCLVQCTTM